MTDAKKKSAEHAEPAVHTLPVHAAKFVPKVIRKITMQVIKIDIGDTVYVKFLSPIETKKKMELDEKTKLMVEKPIDIAHIVMLDTGEEGQIVIGDVLKKNIEEAFANNSYVGLGFQIEKRDVPGKRYKNYLISQIEV